MSFPSSPMSFLLVVVSFVAVATAAVVDLLLLLFHEMAEDFVLGVCVCVCVCVCVFGSPLE